MLPLEFRLQSTEQLILDYILQPLTEAYKRAKKDTLIVYYNENTITRKLVWHLKHDTSISYLYRKKVICIEMRPKEQHAIDDVYEPDIKFVLGTLWMEIESKRIYERNRWSPSEYLGSKGVRRFIVGAYSRENHGGMIGYIQKGDFKKIVRKIKMGLKKMNCKTCEDIIQIENCVLSVHHSNRKNIRIYHLFFYFS
ncbi:MAG: hypothetical protein AYK18_07580 [Theionarchaea archaeon DG-70]|nr:MAG: hypothetical protein AYK18_07580 [Theionarchaea archaeon DG-70]